MQNATFLDDESLIHQFRSGSEKAFNVVYERFYQRVLFFARRFVEEQDAQDIAAETFIQIWLNREEFLHLEGMIRFLFVTTRNSCINKLKKDQTRREAVPKLVLLMEEAASEQYWQDQEVRLELINLIQSHLEALPQKTREVFLLSFNDGLKPSEIAEKLGLSIQTIKNQKVTALKVLREAIGNPKLTVILAILTELKNNH